MHLHILGICGTFMGGLAALAREAGHTVTGCDSGVYPPMSDQLRALGIELIEGYGADQLRLKPDMFVVGNVVSRARLADGTPKFALMEAILDAGLPFTSGPQWLAEHLLPGRHVIAVAGTHGKTTTTAMISWILSTAGLQPGFLVGGVPLNFGVSARLGSGTTFVIEADEYDTAFFDKRSKFVHYRPRTAVLNNLEFDHADIFDDLAAIERQFHHLIRTVPSSGRVVVNGLEESLARVLHKGCWSEVRSFGAAVSDFSAIGPAHDFEVLRAGQRVGQVSWSLSGIHNQLNALAAIAAAEHVGVAPTAAAAALGQFENVTRRMEIRGRVAVDGGHITVYDDFAHHPTAIRTTLDGLRRTLGRGGSDTSAVALAAALQHHEAGHHEITAAVEPGVCRSGVLPQRRARLGRRQRAGTLGRQGSSLQPARCAGQRRDTNRPCWRPHRLHEQWRLWRDARHATEDTTNSIAVNAYQAMAGSQN